MQNFYRLVLFLCLTGAVCLLSSCGKVSAPSPIEGSGYPHSYPDDQRF